MRAIALALLLAASLVVGLTVPAPAQAMRLGTQLLASNRIGLSRVIR